MRGNLIRRRARFTELYAQGLMEITELKKEYARIDAGIERAETGLNTAPADCKNVDEMIMNAAFTNADMRALIEKAVVYPDKTAEVFLK